MSRMPMGTDMAKCVRATIIRSFRWKEFEQGDTSRFPATRVFHEVMLKHKCRSPRAVCKHIMGRCNTAYERRTARVLTATEFLKAIQFMRYNGYHMSREVADSIIRPLAEWIVSRSEEYDKAKWCF